MQMQDDQFDLESLSAFRILKNLAYQEAQSDFKLRVVAYSIEQTHVLFETPYYKKDAFK
jgi:hypothetical protein